MSAAYLVQAEAAERLRLRHGWPPHDSVVVCTPAEASRLVWLFVHPFGPDLAACASTNC